MANEVLARIHNYKYRIQRLRGPPRQSQDASIVAEMARSLHDNDCRFTVFLDINLSIRDLALPIEWMFNRWSITSDTRLAIAKIPPVRGQWSALTIVANTIQNNSAFNAWAACLHHEENFGACQAWGRLLVGLDRDASAREQAAILVMCDTGPPAQCAVDLFSRLEGHEELDERMSSVKGMQVWQRRIRQEFDVVHGR